MVRNLTIVAGIAGAAILLTALVGTLAYPRAAYSQGMGQNSTNNLQSTMPSSQSQDQSPSFIYRYNLKYHDYSNGVLKVRAGAGGNVGPMTVFFPEHAAIKAGESVVFYNPTAVAEPHTVTFVMNNGTNADFSVPFVVGGNTTFAPANPNANAAPVLVPGPNGETMIVANNIRSFSPAVIDSQGKLTLLPPNANYTLTGTEKYVNSGWIWPKGMTPPGLPPIDSFTVKFTNPGTYAYACAIHPWMAGTIEVQ